MSSRVGSLPLYADVRFNVAMTHRNDVIRYVPDWVVPETNRTVFCNVSGSLHPNCSAARLVDRWFLTNDHMCHDLFAHRLPECSSCYPEDCPIPYGRSSCMSCPASACESERERESERAREREREDADGVVTPPIPGRSTPSVPSLEVALYCYGLYADMCDSDDS